MMKTNNDKSTNIVLQEVLPNTLIANSSSEALIVELLYECTVGMYVFDGCCQAEIVILVVISSD